MSSQQVASLKPFLSILIVVATLFTLVFFKIEVRRMGYTVLKDTRVQRALQDDYRRQVMEYAQVTRSERVQKLALSYMSISQGGGQIIQLTGQHIALPQ